MESENLVILGPCANEDNTLLLQTVKAFVADDSDMEITQNEDERRQYLLVTDIQSEAREEEPATSVQKETVNYNQSALEDDPENWPEICRVCANVDDHLIPIFEGEGIDHDLCGKINKHLPIRVCESDTLPLQLCYQCAATLIAWHDLLEGCLESERKLQEIHNSWYSKENYSQTTTDALDVLTAGDTNDSIKTDSRIREEEKKTEPTTKATEQSGYNQNREVANTSIETTRRKIHSTSFNDFRKGLTTFLKSHKVKTKTRKTVISPNVESGEAIDNQEKADTATAKRELKYETSISEVVDNVSETNDEYKVDFNCKMCNEEFQQENLLNDHVILVHQLKTCGNKKSASTKSTKAHEKVQASNELYDCKLCGKKYRLQESYRTHMRVHTGEKPFTCHICGKQFGQTGSLYYHLKHVHDGIKNHSCDICGRSFAMKSAMEDHRRIHTGERPYICHSCGKTFKTKASLYIHGKIHTDNYPYKCTYCTKAFRWRQQMLGHLTIHTGEKNHTCDVCGKGFGVKNDLTRHKRIHSDDKPYACQQCGVKFGQKRYLKSHERSRHP